MNDPNGDPGQGDTHSETDSGNTMVVTTLAHAVHGDIGIRPVSNADGTRLHDLLARVDPGQPQSFNGSGMPDCEPRTGQTTHP